MSVSARQIPSVLPSALLRIVAPALNRGLVSDSAWIALDTLAARGTNLAVMLIAARGLGAHTFGELTIVLGTVILFGSFVAEAIRVTTVKQLSTLGSLDPDARNAAFTVVVASALSSSLVVALLLLSASGIVADQALDAPHLASAIRAGALLVFLDTLAALQRGALLALGAVRQMTIASIASGAIAATLAVAADTREIQTYIHLLTWASVAGNAIRIVEIHRRMQIQRLSLTARISTDLWAVLWRFSLPAVLISLTWAPVNWIGMALLSREEDGFTQIGLIGIANQWFAFLLFLPNIMANALLPRLTERRDADAKDWGGLIRSCAALMVTLVVPLALLLGLVSPWLLGWLYGSSFRAGASTLCLVLAAAVPAAVLNLLGYVLAAQDRMWSSLACGVIWAVVYVAIALLGVHWNLGANALGLAMLAAYSAKLIGYLYVIKRAGAHRHA